MNWKLLEIRILDVIRKAFRQYSEKWVSAETLGEYIETLNVHWLKRYGSCFNRTRVEWDDEHGHHTQGWLYPLNEIKQMLLDGRIKQLKADKQLKV
jgi:hypothetical protein